VTVPTQRHHNKNQSLKKFYTLLIKPVYCVQTTVTTQNYAWREINRSLHRSILVIIQYKHFVYFCFIITEMSAEICKITIGSVFVVFEHEIFPGIRGSIHMD
jgi:hypothetical protein